MKKNKSIVIILCVLVALVAVLAVIHLTTRVPEDKNAIQVVYQGVTVSIPLDELTPVPVQGVRVNGRGEKIQVDGMAVSVAELLKLAGVDPCNVTVTASDEYSVTLTKEEVEADNTAWLFLEEDSVRLIVFGDANSKRDLKQVVRITAN